MELFMPGTHDVPEPISHIIGCTAKLPAYVAKVFSRVGIGSVDVYGRGLRMLYGPAVQSEFHQTSSPSPIKMDDVIRIIGSG
jgi:hypothetical protein